MKLLSLGLDLSWPETKTATTISLDTLIRRLEAAFDTSSGASITPENCMQSPTVHAIVTGISKGMAAAPVHVYQRSKTKDGVKKELLPDHPVERLLKKPNEWQTSKDYWLDATSALLRYGRYYSFKARGQTGPIRRLIPILSSDVTLKQDDQWNVTVTINQANGAPKDYELSDIHWARTGARDFLTGNSPVMDCREAIGLEIAAEKFAASFFGGGAMPGIVFEFMEGFSAFKTDEEKKRFVEDFQNSYGRNTGRFKAMLMPKGIKMSDQLVGFENDKAQMIETRKYQRTVIAGAFGVPPYLVGDLERQTFNNAEQQNINKVQEAILPTAIIFEAAMERDLLTADDRASDVIIRFNIDGLLRGDFLARQQGLKIQREAGVIDPNEWRENENMNPISEEDGGNTYWQTGPSGQGQTPPPPNPPPPVKPNGSADAVQRGKHL